MTSNYIKVTKSACKHCGVMRSEGWIKKHELTCVSSLSIDDLKRIGSVTEEEESGCWRWNKRQSHRYPRYKGLRLSRWMYELKTGEPLGDLFACHSCDNAWCVNPGHIWPGTNKENMDDAVSKNRLKGRKVGPSGRGDNHWARRRPELVIRGDDHYLRKNPERASGSNHWTAKLSKEEVENIYQKIWQTRRERSQDDS